MSRKLAFVLLTALFVLSLLAACSSNTSNQGNQSGNTNTSTNTSDQPENNQTEQQSEESSLDHYNLTMAIPMIGPIPPDMELVEAELNKLTEAKINTTVEILPIGVGTYTEQLNLKFSSGEKLDLAYMFPQLYGSNVAQGKLLALDELLPKYGQGIIEQVGEQYINVPSINGKLYAVLMGDSYVGHGTVYYMRKDIVDKYNIDVSSIKSLEDVENVLKLVKENEPELIPLAVSAGMGPVTSYADYDSLENGFGVLLHYDNNLQVVNLYETQEYADRLALAHKWFKAGYINKDAATTSVLPMDMMGSGRAFSYITSGALNVIAEAETERMVGLDVVGVELVPTHLTTQTIMTGFWTVAQQSENPERAVMFLNLLYTDEEIANLLVWGIEGKHYVKLSENQAGFPEGLDANTVGYNMKNFGWLLGNLKIHYLAEDEPANKREILDELAANTNISPALGFVFNVEPVKNEHTALTNVTDQYRPILETGSVDPAERLPEFIQKLEAAGIGKYIAEKQRQLDEWAAANK
jgi:putative aldouronate transport system substrate-binding protein